MSEESSVTAVASNALTLDLQFSWRSSKFNPRLGACLTLLNDLEGLLCTAEGLSSYRLSLDPKAMDQALSRLQDSDQGSGAAYATVKQLHYGSPLTLEVLVSLTPAGIGFLLWALKRIYAIDLELLAHREQRRVEYLEAKRFAERLEKEAGQDLRRRIKRPEWKSGWRSDRATLGAEDEG